DLRQPRNQRASGSHRVGGGAAGENLHVHGAPEGTDNVARGAVQDIAYLGDLSIYLVKLPTGKVVRVTQPNTSRHAEAITWDQQVYLSWDATSPVVVTRY